MGRIFLEEPPGHSSKTYVCCHCLSKLATVDSILSKSFHSRNGKAYLFDAVYNIAVGKPEERMMTTGLHVVSDINCISCWSSCGWKYVTAHEKSQKYKEGKFILERAKLLDSAQEEKMSQQSSESLEEEESDAEEACI